MSTGICTCVAIYTRFIVLHCIYYEDTFASLVYIIFSTDTNYRESELPLIIPPIYVYIIICSLQYYPAINQDYHYIIS